MRARLFNRTHLASLAALIICLGALFSNLWTASRIFENLPHLEDEMAYVWEAKAIAGGRIWVPAPQCSRCFLVPFVIDYEGRRFGKYPIAWPVLLALGIRLGVRGLVNPLLGAACVWLTYRLGRKLFNPAAGLLAAFLTAASPFFIMNTSSLLSHTWGLFLTLVFVIAWIDTFFPGLRRPGVPAWLAAASAALTLGLLGLSRPLTGAAVAAPFAIHGLLILARGGRQTRILAGTIAAGVALLASLHVVWQYALTGDPFLNPYTLWWEYDRIGFGPGVGLQTGGYSLQGAWANTRFSLGVLTSDLFGWPMISPIFLPFGLWAGRRSAPAWLLFSLFPAVTGGYALYWISSALFGPRYYFEALPALAILVAAGICWLAGKAQAATPQAKGQTKFFRHARWISVVGITALLAGASLVYYLPVRLGPFHGLYGVAAEHTLPFRQAQALGQTPALVIVHKQYTWYEYGTLIDLNSPYLDTPFVIIYDPAPADEAKIIPQFPGRQVFHYYRDEPYRFYRTRR